MGRRYGAVQRTGCRRMAAMRPGIPTGGVLTGSTAFDKDNSFITRDRIPASASKSLLHVTTGKSAVQVRKFHRQVAPVWRGCCGG